MAKYRAQASLYLGKGVTVRPGEHFTSDAVPGKNWEPLDEEAEARVKAHFNGKPSATADTMPTIPIADNWESLHWTQRVKLAKELAGDFVVPDGKTEGQIADGLIREEVARRKAANPQT